MLSLDGEEGRVTLVGVGPTPLEAWACVQLLQDVHVAVAPTTHWAMHSGQRWVVRIVLTQNCSLCREGGCCATTLEGFPPNTGLCMGTQDEAFRCVLMAVQGLS